MKQTGAPKKKSSRQKAPIQKYRREIVRDVVSSGVSSKYIADKAVQIIIHTGADKHVDEQLGTSDVFTPNIEQKIVKKRWFSDVFSQFGDIRSILEVVTVLYAIYRINDIARFVVGTLNGASKIQGTVIQGNPKSQKTVNRHQKNNNNNNNTGSSKGSV